MGNKQSHTPTGQDAQTTTNNGPTLLNPPFKQNEMNQLIETFRRKIGTSPIQDASQLENWFGFDAKYASHFHIWMQSVTKSYEIDINQWITSCSILLSDPEKFPPTVPSEYKRLKKLDILVWISIYPKPVNEDTEFLNQDLIQLFQTLFGLCYPDSKASATLYANRIYDDTLRESNRATYVLSKFNAHLPASQNLIRSALKSLIFEGRNRNELPKIDHQAEVLRQEYLTLLCMSDHKICNTSQLQLLYSNVKSGSSFNRLAWNILGYGGPTLLIMKLTKKQNFHGTSFPIVYGAYHPSEWSDGLKYQGDTSTYLFSMSPCFRQFTTYSSKGGTNYAYLNTKFIDKSKYRVGLGFGGMDDFGKFRLWLDDDLENRSQVLSDDDCFSTGYVAGELEGRLEIDRIEIWGLGGPGAVAKQEEYRQLRQEEYRLERMRKVDKKAFFNAFDQEFLLSKTFAHRAQVREDVRDDDCNNCQRKKSDQ